ncbi:hypothetical protein B0A48_11962 [Cryoendolithus antarcticus]|uniref:F-box domain-containing protein n=1 Tax=Cryoendolithus antarcticus TaxID=1507870 RepID=A0A1V8STB2_9PEZI|nr:hypothetical protein B0A48_11962 [Cryoendolithus antarcticus]
MSRPQIADRLGRSDRGLLTYENCSVGELEAFALQRGIGTSDADPALTKTALIRILHHADDRLSFPRLFDLPPEVCVMIYESYCAHFSEEHLHMPTPPPLALVCRRLREDVMPVFYGECSFRIELTEPSARCRLVPKTALFFSTLPAASLARIRWLHIYMRFDSHRWQDEDEIAQIQLSGKGTKFSLQTMPYVNPDASERMPAEVQALVEQKLRPVLDAMLSRTQGRGHVVLMDIHRLLWAMQDSWTHYAFDEYRYEDTDHGAWESDSDY